MRTKKQSIGGAGSGGCRIALVDGDTATQATMRAHLATAEPGWRLDIYSSGGEALWAMSEEPPQLVLMEQALPDGCGLDCARLLRARCPQVQWFVHTTQGCPEKLFQSLTLGAMGYVVKGESQVDWVPHVRKAMAGCFTMCDQAARLLPQAFHGVRMTGEQWNLSRREKEVMLSLCRYGRNKDIANALGISETTVHAHLANIFKKLNVHDRQSAIQKFTQKWSERNRALL